MLKVNSFIRIEKKIRIVDKELFGMCFASRKCLVLQPKVPSPLASIAVI